MVDLTLLTGPSGSGATSAKFVFEELGYYVVENPPVESIHSIADVFSNEPYENIKCCIIIPIMNASKAIETLKKVKDIKLTVVLLSTDKEELMKRYTLTRHVHPRAVIHKISLEKAILEDIKEAHNLQSESDIYIDTSTLIVKELRHLLLLKLDSRTHKTTLIQFTSFGLKNGIPIDIDTLIDVRTIPNPYWVEELRSLTGFDKPVIDYINSFPISKKTIKNIINYLEFILKEVVESGRASYNVGVACSGGQHRSTYIANVLEQHFKEKYNVLVIHRDIQR